VYSYKYGQECLLSFVACGIKKKKVVAYHDTGFELVI
jgi:hypothetical protein